MHDQTGDVLERRCAQVLGTSLPTPDRSPQRRGRHARGRSGRALTAWLTRDASKETTAHHVAPHPVTRGVELHVDADHPLARLGSEDQGCRDTAPGDRELLPHSP